MEVSLPDQILLSRVISIFHRCAGSAGWPTSVGGKGFLGRQQRGLRPLCVLGLGLQLGPRAPPGGEGACSTLRAHGVLRAPSNAFADLAAGYDCRRFREGLPLESESSVG